MVALYYVNDVLEVQSMLLVIGLVSAVAWNVYEVCPSDMYLQVRQFFRMGMSAGAGCVM